MLRILWLDQRIALYLNRLTGQGDWLDSVLKFVAVGFVYIIPAILLFVWFLSGQKEKLTLIRITFFGIFGWLFINNIIGLVWFRKRPFIKLVNTRELVFHPPDKSFPSDHATLGFAVAIGFILAGYRKLGVFMFVWTLVFSITRVIVGVHFPLDIVGGLVIGGTVAFLGDVLKDSFDRYVGAPLVRLARLVRLA